MPALSDVAQFISSQFFGRTTLPNADLTGKTFIVTGANTGLGLEAAKHLARMGSSRLVLACRNIKKGENARSTIQSIPNVSKSLEILVWEVDLDHHPSVVSFCERVESDLDRLDGIILNAGIELSEFELSERLERTVNINVVSTFLMAVGVLPKLQESARSFKTHTNITIVGSLIHVFGADHQMDVAGNILESLSDPKTARIADRYALSKLMVHMCFNEMVDTMLPPRKPTDADVVVNIVNPGWCATELFRSRSRHPMEKLMFALIGRTGEEGSRTLVDGVLASGRAHGCYLSECTVKTQSAFVRSARGRAMQKKLWAEVAARIREASPRCGRLITDTKR